MMTSVLCASLVSDLQVQEINFLNPLTQNLRAFVYASLTQS